MALYRHKPTTVDAEQFTDADKPPRGVNKTQGNYPYFYVMTMQGRAVDVSLGEWIVAEQDGKGYYPVADAEFRRSYQSEDELQGEENRKRPKGEKGGPPMPKLLSNDELIEILYPKP